MDSNLENLWEDYDEKEHESCEQEYDNSDVFRSYVMDRFIDSREDYHE